jgi:hypothetical protein
MNTSIEVYLGAPIEIESERQFLSKLCGDLNARGLDALILANFLLPPHNPAQQIDFLVILKHLVCHIELKNLTAPVTGSANGTWHLILPDGSAKDSGNPYRQALNCKFAISDEMHKLANREPHLKTADGSKFYKHFESVVCVYPDLLAGSKVPSDRRIHVLGYPQLLELLTQAKRNPGWSPEEWKYFAMEMGLLRQEELVKTSKNPMQEAEELLAAYSKRFLDCYGPRTAKLVPTTIEASGNRKESNQCFDLFTRGKHGQLIGPSGSGKSLHAEYYAMKALEGGRIPIFVRAIEYAGKLTALLDRGIAHLCPRSGTAFIEAVRRVGRPLTLIIDGFNECPSRFRSQLIQDMHAAYLRWEIAIVITTQQEVVLPGELSGEQLHFCAPSSKERQAILSSYATTALPANIDELTVPFRSAYELSIAAVCLSELRSNRSRAGLFEVYLRHRCADIVDPVLAKRLLSEIARYMHAELRSSLPIEQVWRIGEAVLDGQHAPLSTLQGIISCGLVDVRQGQCTFRHELLQRFFEAIALVRECSDVMTLYDTLLNPINQDLVEFVLGMQSQESAMRACLKAAGSSAILLCTACIQGQFGGVARKVVMSDIEEMLQQAKSDVANFETVVSLEQLHESYTAVEITGSRQWSDYEFSLMGTVAQALKYGLFFDEVVNLIGETENCCISQMEGKLGVDIVRKRSFRSSLFWQLFVIGNPIRSLPASTIIRSIDGLFAADVQSEVLERIGQRFNQIEDLSAAQIYFLLSFVRGNPLPEFCDAANVINHSWNLGLYHLRLKILDCVLYWRNSNLSEATISTIADALSNLRTADPVVRTVWFETMLAYELVEPPITVEQVQKDIAEVIAQPDDTEAQQSAYHIVSSVFESMFDDVVYRAIDGLNTNEQKKLYTMAALAVPPYSMSGDYILSRLLELNDAESLPAFRRFVQELDGEAFCPQYSDSCFVLGHVGCAKYVNEPGRLTDLSNDDRRAWQCYGEIIFWLSKPTLADDQVANRCRSLWQTLQTSLAFEAVDPLRRLAHITRKDRDGSSADIVQRLFSMFQYEVREILHFGLRHRDNLSAIDKRLVVDASIREQTTFMVYTLGQIGNSESVEVLLPLVDDKHHGHDAVEAIRRIRSGERSSRLSVMHRVP